MTTPLRLILTLRSRPPLLAAPPALPLSPCQQSPLTTTQRAQLWAAAARNATAVATAATSCAAAAAIALPDVEELCAGLQHLALGQWQQQQQLAEGTRVWGCSS